MNDKSIKLKNIGYLCKKYRKIKGIKQQTVAKHLKLSQARISLFEQGKNDSLYIYLGYIELDIISNIP